MAVLLTGVGSSGYQSPLGAVRKSTMVATPLEQQLRDRLALQPFATLHGPSRQPCNALRSVKSPELAGPIAVDRQLL